MASSIPHPTSSGRELPNDWMVSTVKSCIGEISTGLNPQDNFELGHSDIQYVTVKKLTTSGVIDFKNVDVIDKPVRAVVHKKSDISIGDVLYASITPLGRTHLILKEPETWNISTSSNSFMRFNSVMDCSGVTFF